MSERTYLEVEPKGFSLPIGKWVNQEILFTNIISETYHNLVISLRPPWQVNLKQKRYILNNLDPGVSKSIGIEARVQAQPGESFPLQLTIHIDEKPPQRLSLSVFAEKVDELAEKDALPEPEVMPTIKEFRDELRKLTDDQLADLCQEEAFSDLYDSLFTAPMAKPERIRRIVDYCRGRRKFPELHEALKEILQQDYAFFNH